VLERRMQDCCKIRVHSLFVPFSCHTCGDSHSEPVSLNVSWLLIPLWVLDIGASLDLCVVGQIRKSGPKDLFRSVLQSPPLPLAQER